MVLSQCLFLGDLGLAQPSRNYICVTRNESWCTWRCQQWRIGMSLWKQSQAWSFILLNISPRKVEMLHPVTSTIFLSIQTDILAKSVWSSKCQKMHFCDKWMIRKLQFPIHMRLREMSLDSSTSRQFKKLIRWYISQAYEMSVILIKCMPRVF